MGLRGLVGGFGLSSAATNLSGAAAALTAAAGRLGGVGAAGAAASVAGGGAAGVVTRAAPFLKALPGIGTAAGLGGLALMLEPNLFGGSQPTPEQAARNARIGDARRKAWNEERARMGISPLGGSSDFTLGSNGTFANAGAGPFKSLDTKVADTVAVLTSASDKSYDAGKEAGAAFTRGFAEGIAPADDEARAMVRKLIETLTFSASPSVTPRGGQSGGSQAPGGTARGGFSDYGVRP